MLYPCQCWAVSGVLVDAHFECNRCVQKVLKSKKEKTQRIWLLKEKKKVFAHELNIHMTRDEFIIFIIPLFVSVAAAFRQLPYAREFSIIIVHFNVKFHTFSSDS